MRWDEQRIDESEATQRPLIDLPGLVRSVCTPDFDGVVFHEVRARSVLNKVPNSSRMPFRWTVNPYRGCSHACRYCFARNSHTYLDFDAGRDFDTQVVVKVNAADVLAGQLRSRSWAREHVAMGTNTDPYQRAEGKYQLMPGIIRALAGSGTPFSILTKGTVLRRDIGLLSTVAGEVSVGVAVSIALLDPELQRRLEPGTPSPRARLEMVRKVRDAGLSCGVVLAPVLPGLTDSRESLESTIAAIADAGATGVTTIPLHLRPGAREWFTGWLERDHPGLVPTYRRLYRRGSNAEPGYRRWLASRVGPLIRKYGLAADATDARGDPGDESSGWPAGSVPTPREAAREQLTLL